MPWRSDSLQAVTAQGAMSQEALLDRRKCLAASLQGQRSISHTFSLRGKQPSRQRSMQSESLDYHTIHNRACLVCVPAALHALTDS